MIPSLVGRRPRLTRALVGAALIAVAALASAAAPPSAAARDDGHGRPYLALGDSVPFGYITEAGFEYTNPTNFVGYPEHIGIDRGLDVVNLACPGQTTSSMISMTGPDNGCVTFRASAPLHVAYQGTQLAFAAQYLRGHDNTRLVTLMLGANDGFLLQKSCAAAPNPALCVAAGVPALLATVATNLETIYTTLRGTGYHGRIVAVTYYSLDYNDVAGTALTQLLDGAIVQEAHAHGALVGDAFATFKAASSTVQGGGSPCRAGLLNALPQNQFLCDVHPSQSGQQLLARTVEDALGAAGGS